MNATLLKTKLYLPRARRGAVARPRLYERLNMGLDRKLTLVSAPAGFGKTTLIAEWRASLGERALPMGWISLDAADNDPVQFWAYFAAALDGVQPGAGSAVTALLRSAEPAAPDQILRELTNAAAEIPSDFLIGLDDYHVIESPAIHEALAALLEHLPPQCHLLVLSRADPPLPLARLRARQELQEVRVRDLRFREEETAGLVVSTGAPAISAEGLAQLTARTEGWAAGLQLALLSLETRADVEQFLTGLQGTNRYIVDYLVEEVFGQQPADLQHFLLTTSVLDRLSGPLCDAVTGQENSRATLAALEQRNLFTVALDDEREWYRYHHLFAAMLRTRLEQTVPGEAARLHSRASRWYEANGMQVEATRAALSAGEADRAAGLLGTVADEMVGAGEAATFRTLLGGLPAAVLQNRPDLLIMDAAVLQGSGQVAQAEARLQEAEVSLQGALARGDAYAAEWQGRSCVVKSCLARMRDQYDRGTELAREALALLRPDSLRFRSMATLNLAICLQNQGAGTEALPALEEAARASAAAGNLHMAVISACALGEVLEARGDLAGAETWYEWALRTAGGEKPTVIGAGWALVATGGIWYERGRVAEAMARVQEGLAFAARHAHLDALARGWTLLLHIHLMNGNPAAARPCVTRLEELLGNLPVPQARAALTVARAKLLAAEGELEQAWQLAESEGALGVDPSLTAQLGTALGRPVAAVAQIEPMAAMLRQMELNGQAIGAYRSLAEARWAAGEREAALADLTEALRWGEAGGFVRTLAGRGARLVGMLRALLERGVMPGYVARMLEAMGEEAVATAPPLAHSNRAQVLVEPLSERELEVLAMIAAGLSSQEIAEQAFISPGTVKRHIHNIVGKLGAADRQEAVRIARTMGLI
jgi:LuxR family maltose regulon positive regulatory protein